MANSLLAHLFQYIKGSQEDIATYSLQYLLSQSTELNAEFTNMVAKTMHIELDSTLQYFCQVAGDDEDLERPDMVGNDVSGKEIVLFEMKFYASLTQNQPNTYLKRLKENSGKGLMFICPASRRTSLWAQLKELCGDIITETLNEFCVDVSGVKLAIVTWSYVIELLKQTASSVDVRFVSDIQQLEGYCERIDSDAFIPFSEEDLSAKVAKAADRYYQVVDEVIDMIMADEHYITSKKGVKATAYRRGYTRSLHIDDFAITLNYDRNLWKNPASVETPFWVAIRNSDWRQTTEIIKYLKRIPERYTMEFWNMLFIALIPKQNATLSEVCEDVKNQILSHINEIKGM